MKAAIEEGRFDKIPTENFQAMDKVLAMGKALVVLTSREHVELKHMLEPDHELFKRMVAFYYHDNMEYHKPDPRAFEHIEREHNWKPEECVYVGDSLSDAVAAKGTGMHFIASLESGLLTKEDFLTQPAALVDIFIHRFHEIVTAIRQLDSAA
jgi:phosphoglycolate phosphatase-like HAD superfamily hydrolase